MATAIRYRRLTMMKRLSMSAQAVFGAWAGGSLITFGLITVGLVLPILAGLAGAVMPATGVFPALGGDSISLQPAQDFLATPGLGRSIWLTISIGVGTTCLALAGTFSILAAAASTGRPLKWLRRVIGPMIAVPPSAVAIVMAKSSLCARAANIRVRARTASRASWRKRAGGRRVFMATCAYWWIGHVP